MVNSTEIISVDFVTKEDQKIAIVSVRGHFNASANTINNLLHDLFEGVSKRWRISQVDYDPPLTSELASQGILRVEARTYNG